MTDPLFVYGTIKLILGLPVREEEPLSISSIRDTLRNSEKVLVGNFSFNQLVATLEFTTAMYLTFLQYMKPDGSDHDSLLETSFLLYDRFDLISQKQAQRFINTTTTPTIARQHPFSSKFPEQQLHSLQFLAASPFRKQAQDKSILC